MATTKSYTSLEQSKILAEILPLESADMRYSPLGDTHPWVLTNTLIEKDSTPCWSLAALLGVLPKGTNIRTPNPINELRYRCWNHYDEIYADNPIDVCYEMIVRVHELKMSLSWIKKTRKY